MATSASTPPTRAITNRQASTAAQPSNAGPPASGSGTTRKTRTSARKPSAQPNGTLKPDPQHPGHVSDSAAQQTPSKKGNTAGYSDNNGHNTNGTIRKKQGKRKPQAQQPGHVSAAVPNIDGTASLPPSYSQPPDNTHPPSAAVATPIKAAYAGPTFHASPAASTLPKPKFFSKSVPSAAPTSSLQAKLDAEPDSGSNKTPSPESDAALPAPLQPQHGTPVAREESPLDVFFSAHRAEQYQQRDSHTPEANSRASHSTPSLHPSTSTNSRQTPSTMPRSARARPSQSSSGKQAFLMELDGQAEDADAERSGQGYESSDWDDQRALSPAQQPKIPFSAKLRGCDHSQRPSSEGGALQGNAPFPQRAPFERNIPSDDLQRQAQSQALKQMLMMQPSQGSKKPSLRQSSRPWDEPQSHQQHPATAQAPASPLSPMTRRDHGEHQYHGRQASAPVELPATSVGPRDSPHASSQRRPSNGYGSSNYSSIYGANNYTSPPPRQAQIQMAPGSYQPTQQNSSNGRASGHMQQPAAHDLRSVGEPGGQRVRGMEDDLRRMLRLGPNGT